MSLDIALLRELKDAGYPLRRNVFADKDLLEPEFVSPLLEELINACADSFEALERMFYGVGKDEKPTWKALMTEDAFDKTGIACVRDCDGYEVGSTPTEAVARLWIALNRKV